MLERVYSSYVIFSRWVLPMASHFFSLATSVLYKQAETQKFIQRGTALPSGLRSPSLRFLAFSTCSLVSSHFLPTPPPNRSLLPPPLWPNPLIF